MKRLVKKNELNDFKFEYTLEGFVCPLCNEKIYSEDGAYKVTKDGKSINICEDCYDEYIEQNKKDELLNDLF